MEDGPAYRPLDPFFHRDEIEEEGASIPTPVFTERADRMIHQLTRFLTEEKLYPMFDWYGLSVTHRAGSRTEVAARLQELEEELDHLLFRLTEEAKDAGWDLDC